MQETNLLNMNNKVIRLTESDLHKIVKKSVNRILKEEIDMGQVRSSDEILQHQNYLNRMRNKGNGLEYQKRIRYLRRIIDDVEKQFGEDASEGISLMIKKLKKMWADENGL